MTRVDDAGPGRARDPASCRFVVLGAGGLGSPAILGLLAAGASRITIVDDDRVAASNLQRQVLYNIADRGRAKTDAALQFARMRGAHLDRRGVRMTRAGLHDLLDELRTTADSRSVVLECSDDASLKFDVNDVCVARGVDAVIGGVLGWRGQITVVQPGGPCLRCLFEQPPPPEITPTCGSVGVIGAAAGFTGYWMTLLALRVASKQPVGPAFRTIDSRTGRCTELALQRRPQCPACRGAPESDQPGFLATRRAIQS
ncbi:MAG: hypothetical protein B7733_05320 [Myxococcales bacterium FL481]|nr:MAG: hypothetical protein B7733_05320 [Myxococcales bacterium FL481]